MNDAQTNEKPTTQKLACDIGEAAEKLSCSPGSIRKFIRQRRLPRLEGFRKILIPVAALENFVKESTIAE